MLRPSMSLIRALRQALAAEADPARAPAMQAYMKSDMPYLGVQTPQCRKASRSVFAAYSLESFDTWRDTLLQLWRGARFREERYAAIGLAGYPAYRKFRTLQALPVYEEMIVTGAWWDFVDAIASHRIGELLRKHPAEMAALLRKWARSDNLWKRRSAILAQLQFKSGTDLGLLYDCIQPSLGEREFFLRKAIGWALRQYAKTDATEVICYVREHESELSPLSQREALKNVGSA